MALVLRNIYGFYSNFVAEHTDPRVESYYLLGSPIPVFFVIFLYLFLVMKWGPKKMEHHEPFELNRIITFYNLCQIIINATVFIVGLRNSYIRSDFSLICQPVDYTNDRTYMRNLINVTYLYYLSKYVDLLDTVFFVLRKKNNQVTFLHVYHHGGMVFGTYIFSKFLSGSHPTLLGIINSFVHVIMYSYYFITSLNPERKRSLWWKRYITQLQLAQFAYLVIHFLFPLINTTCTYPKLISFIGLIQCLFMFSLFYDFYNKAYVKKKEAHLE